MPDGNDPRRTITGITFAADKVELVRPRPTALEAALPPRRKR